MSSTAQVLAPFLFAGLLSIAAPRPVNAQVDVGSIAGAFTSSVIMRQLQQRLERIEGPASLSADSRKAAQERLAALGLYTGGIDGVWGPATQAAFDRYRAERTSLAANAPFGKVLDKLMPGVRAAGDTGPNVKTARTRTGSTRGLVLPDPAPAGVPTTAAVGAPQPVALVAARLFVSGVLQPPREVRGYGMFVFKSQATEFDQTRQMMLCQAYVASQVAAGASGMDWRDLFITAWPVTTGAMAAELNARPRGHPSEICTDAVANYDLELARQARTSARRAGFEDNGIGPYLLGWLPSSSFGQPDALILTLDLSQVEDYRQALALFQQWQSDIEADPQLNGAPGALDRLRRTLRVWADTYGEGMLQLVGG